MRRKGSHHGIRLRLPAAWIFSSRNELICLTGFGERSQACGFLFNNSFNRKPYLLPYLYLDLNEELILLWKHSMALVISATK